MASAQEYADWIVKNAEKKGTPEFDTVAKAYKAARSQPTEAPAKAPAKAFGAQLSDSIADVPRQVGLTARAGLQGIGNLADMVTAPIRVGLNSMLPEQYAIQPGIGRMAANSLGLPQPKPGLESLVGSMAENVAGGAIPIAAAGRLAQGATGVTQAVAQRLAAAPAQQLASAAAAGGAGGYVRETGGGEGAQMLASLAGGIAAPYAMAKGQQAAGALAQRVRAPALSQVDIDVQIDSALQPGGLTLESLTPAVRAGIRADVAEALKISPNLSPDAVRRLADYRMTGATPTAGGLTLDPGIVTRQKNLSKLGANSKDPAAQALSQTENQNNKTLISEMNKLGAGTTDTPIAAGRKVISALDGRVQAAEKVIGQRYDAARGTEGRPVALDPYAFTQKANNLLDDALVGGKLPADVRNKLNAIATGNHPLNVEIAEQLKTRIGALQRSSQDGQERLALGMVRRALDDTPLLNDGQGLGAESIKAFNRARRLNRAWEGIVENTPALEAVRDGIEPDKFVQTFIVGNGAKANFADLKALQRSVKASPEAKAAVREQIAAHLKAKALGGPVGGTSDEIGSFSQSNFNKALAAIGEEKLALFFNKTEIDQLKAIGRVASYEQVQPRGSAVNNSNTAGAGLAAIFDRLADSPFLSKIPGGNLISQPAQNISVGIRARQAMNVPAAIAGERARLPKGFTVSPVIPLTDEDKNKKRNLRDLGRRQ